jgi:hypothetical protein
VPSTIGDLLRHGGWWRAGAGPGRPRWRSGLERRDGTECWLGSRFKGHFPFRQRRSLPSADDQRSAQPVSFAPSQPTRGVQGSCTAGVRTGLSRVRPTGEGKRGSVGSRSTPAQTIIGSERDPPGAAHRPSMTNVTSEPVRPPLPTRPYPSLDRSGRGHRVPARRSCRDCGRQYSSMCSRRMRLTKLS